MNGGSQRFGVLFQLKGPYRGDGDYFGHVGLRFLKQLLQKGYMGTSGIL